MKLIKAFGFALFLAAFWLVVPLAAQSPADPVYAFIDRWEARGYLEPLYTLRPYSPPVIISILERVISQGSEADAELARGFLERYAAPGFDVKAVQRSDARLGVDTFAYRGESGVELELLAQVMPGVWTQGKIDVILQDGLVAVKPETERPCLDIHVDGSMNFMPIGLSGDPMAILYGLSTASWFGNEKLWGSASYARSSVGPFFDNGIVIGPQAHAAPNWSINAAMGPWRFSSAIFQLTTRNDSKSKYLAFHSYSVSPLAGLELGVFESAVWAGAFKPTYMVPLSMMYYLQSMSRYGDNSLAGLYGSWRPLDGLVAKASVYFDDVGFSDLVKFHFDTKIIGAAQAGLLWAPAAGPLSLASLDYTAVFPYMYAHYHAAGEEDNYTHFGDSIGAALEPNSERWELRARFMPYRGMNVEVLGRLMRHGNASTGITSGDGSWFDDGWLNGQPTYQEPFKPGTVPEYFRFLSQDTIKTSAQLGVSLSVDLAIGRTQLSVAARYLLESVWNYGLVAGNDKLFHYIGLDAAWRL